MGGHVQFEEGIPEDIPSLFPPTCRPGVLVLDDLMRDCSDDERILDLFTIKLNVRLYINYKKSFVLSVTMCTQFS